MKEEIKMFQRLTHWILRGNINSVIVNNYCRFNILSQFAEMHRNVEKGLKGFKLIPHANIFRLHLIIQNN